MAPAIRRAQGGPIARAADGSVRWTDSDADLDEVAALGDRGLPRAVVALAQGEIVAIAGLVISYVSVALLVVLWITLIAVASSLN